MRISPNHEGSIGGRIPDRRIVASLLLILASAFAILCVAANARSPLTFDEIDYVNVAKLGFFKNYTDGNSLTPLQFYKVAADKTGKHGTSALSDFSTLPQESTDSFQLRHFHPALPAMFWSGWAGIGNSDTFWHYSMLVPLLLVVLVFGFSQKRTMEPYFLLSAAVFVASNAFVDSYLALNFHAFHIVATLFFLFMFAREIEAPSRRMQIVLGIAAALLVLTSEMGLVMIALALVAVLFLRVTNGVYQWSGLVRIIATFLIAVAISWPGFYTKAWPLKVVAMYAYRIVFHGNTEYAHVAVGQFWLTFAARNVFAVLWAAGGVVLTIAAVWKRRLPSAYLAPLIVALGYGVFMSPFALSDVYMAPALGLLCGQAALVLYGLDRAGHARPLMLPLTLLVAAAVICAFVTAPFVRLAETANHRAAALRNDVRVIRATVPADRRVLAFAAHIPQYFLPEYRMIDAGQPFGGDVRIYSRIAYRYVPLEQELRSKQYAAILIDRALPADPRTRAYLGSLGYRCVDLDQFALCR